MLHNFILTIVYILLPFTVHSKSAGRRNELVPISFLFHLLSLITCFVQYQNPSINGFAVIDPSSWSENGSLSIFDVKRRELDSIEQGSLGHNALRYLNAQSKSCWITLNARQHFETMDNLDANYADARQSFDDAIQDDNVAFDDKLLQAMLQTRGRVSGPGMDEIPAGLNLGGYCMMRMEKSVLFFHRMKLRNNTRFRINYLHTDLREMQIAAQLSLNDLHLFGNYERAVTDNDPSILYYTPTYGQIEILLKNVNYKMEGRLRMLEDSLFIVLVNSEINIEDSLLIHKNNASNYENAIVLERKHINEFVERMKSDLDKWLRDYFNEHLIFFKTVGPAANARLREYEKKKTSVLNNYVEEAIVFLKNKLRRINATNVKIPSFTIFSMKGLELKLKDGVLRGLDSMYRRSVATGKKENNIRKVDAIVGFSSLKLVYKYNAYLTTGVPPLSGLLILSADELTSHMALSLIKDPETVDVQFDFIQQLKPESLTVEGPANRMIANFKHILEYHIISIMTNTLIHNIRALSSLTKCRPDFFGHVDPDELPSENSLETLQGKVSKDPNQRSPDYVVAKEDSIEVELAPNAQGEQKRLHLAHVQSLNITKLNKK